MSHPRRVLAALAALASLALWWALGAPEPASSDRSVDAVVAPRARVAEPWAQREPRRATEAPAPDRVPHLSPPKQQRFVFRGASQPIVIREYSPPYELPKIPPADDAEWVKTPEGTLAAMHSAMAAGDFDRWFGLWSPKSRAYMQGQWQTLMEQQQLNSQDKLLGIWRYFRASRFRLTRRIEIPGYVMVEVGTETEGWISPLAVLTFEEGRWWLSQDLVNNPIPAMAFVKDEVRIEDI